ncbi:MAG: phytanoyl-CoA dioxygenase family protein [Pseudomonadales bacterium]|nr:phytanoyl-CoA dioxygenase family protein [Pseudomonadales bacterium]
MLVNPDNQILSLLQQQAHADYIGEPVSQLEHALQCACFAMDAGADEAVVLAALLHDIGHVCDPAATRMADVGVRLHEHVGADYLRACGLFDSIAELVSQHVNAKRYLVATREAYRRHLSPASEKTLAFQGGPMSREEAAAFEKHPQFEQILKLRAWDEAAKIPDKALPDVSVFDAMIQRHRRQRLTDAQLKLWHEQGYLHIKDWFSPVEVQQLVATIDDLVSWPDAPGQWMKYYETTGRGKQLCRIENFLQYVPQLSRLARGEAMLTLISRLMEEPAVLFKEKLNLKLSGGNGFLPHQDAPAFTTFGQTFHITMMVSVDATTSANGCLEVVPGHHRAGLLPTAEDLTMSPEVADNLTWQSVETEPGDLLLFGSFLPHRSGPNATDGARRALYITYNRAAEGGDVRDAYFQLKRQSFPPEAEREAGKHYDPGVFNVGNPVDK